MPKLTQTLPTLYVLFNGITSPKVPLESELTGEIYFKKLEINI
jgi:hypothetical protein